MTSDILFSEDLKHNNIDNWKQILNHDFIIEIAEDILPIGKFIFYLKQDQIFLEAFCNLLAAASTIAYEEETREWFESMIDDTTGYESDTS